MVVAPASYLDRVEMAEHRLGVLASEPRVKLPDRRQHGQDVAEERGQPRVVSLPIHA
jgi:hypothetical protein